MLYVRESRIGAIWPNIGSVPWGGTPEDPPKGARQFDALGQRDDAAIAALADTAVFHEAMTPAGVEARSTEIADRLRAGLQDLDVPFVSTANPAFTSSVIIMRAPRENASRLVSNVYDEAGVQGAAVGGLRLSPHIYNPHDHVDRAIAAVRKHRDLFA